MAQGGLRAGFECRLDWPGKAEAWEQALEWIHSAKGFAELDPGGAEDHGGNLFFIGDNLKVLRRLLWTHKGKLDQIYIDPPYNTKGKLAYKDDFHGHAPWLNFMCPRLLMARELLKSTGVLQISIDDNESAYLKVLCDEIFGCENHLVTHYVQVRYGGKTLSEKAPYQKVIEQVLVYQKEKHVPIRPRMDYSLDPFCHYVRELAPGRTFAIGGKRVDVFRPDEFTLVKGSPSLEGLKATWASGSVLKCNASGRFFGQHLAPRKEWDGLGVLYKVWGVGEDGLGHRYFTGPRRLGATKGQFFSGIPLSVRTQLEAGAEACRATPLVNFHDFAHAFGNCRQEGGVGFRGGKKPVAFLEKLIAEACPSNGWVMDFFAGSGSTAHAVLRLNRTQGAQRRYILVQSPEPIDPHESDLKGSHTTIADLCRSRLRGVEREMEIPLCERAAEIDLSREDPWLLPHSRP